MIYEINFPILKSNNYGPPILNLNNFSLPLTFFHKKSMKFIYFLLIFLSTKFIIKFIYDDLSYFRDNLSFKK